MRIARLRRTTVCLIGLIVQVGGLAPASAAASGQVETRQASPASIGETPVPHRAAIRVTVDILPGESRNIVDMAAPDPIPVALLGSPSFDPRSVDPGSLRLAGATIVKNDEGVTHLLEDVDADGFADL